MIMHHGVIVEQTHEKPIIVDEFHHDKWIKVAVVWNAFIVYP